MDEVVVMMTDLSAKESKKDNTSTEVEEEKTVSEWAVFAFIPPDCESEGE